MRRVLPLILFAVAACGDASGPDIETPRTVLFYREDTGENFLINSDGSAGHVLDFTDHALIPVGISTNGDRVAFLNGSALVTGAVSSSGRLDTVLNPVPQRMSLVSFSNDDRYIALYQYLPTPLLLVVDLAGGVDTLRPAAPPPVLPPVFSPSGDRIALVSATQLSIQLTVVERDNEAIAPTAKIGFSLFLYRPVFGWPRWTAEGLLLATVHAGTDWDTLTVLAVNPDQPPDLAVQVLKVASPILTWDAASTYALAADGRAVVVAAVPPVRGGRELYYGSPRAARLTSLLNDPAALPAFPLILP